MHREWNSVSSETLPPRSRLRAILRVLLLALLLIATFFPALTLWALRLDRTRARLVQGFFKCVTCVIGLKTTRIGSIDKARPLMMVANHAGYLDVFVLGAIAPVSFTPKREVRSWPVIGFLCVLADCVFVERKPSHMEQARRSMRKRLNRDKILCLFPEGTTSDNTNVIPFKSGFFSLAENEEGEEPLPVQPVTLAFTAIGNQPMQHHWRSRVAWVGDDTFFDHFWRVLKLPSVQVTVQFHQAHILPPGGSRKALSQECERIIGESLKALHGLSA